MRSPVIEHENDILVIYNPTNKDFTVKWGGTPRTVEAHGTVKYPRFLAEHLAKHLADFVLQVKEYQHKKATGKVVNLMRNTAERSRVMGLIVRGVESYFLPQDESGLQKIQEQAAVTEEERRSVLDLGDIENDAMGVTMDDIEIDVPPEAKSGDLTKDEIMDQLKVLGIEFTSKETKAELLKKLGVDPAASSGVSDVTIEERSTVVS